MLPFAVGGGVQKFAHAVKYSAIIVANDANRVLAAVGDLVPCSTGPLIYYTLV
jgi:hypothetical protein